VVVLGDLDADRSNSIRQAEEVAEKIRISLKEPYRLTLPGGERFGTGVEQHCSASIGVVLFPNPEASQADLLKWADVAMYQAKDAGRNSVRFFCAVRGLADRGPAVTGRTWQVKFRLSAPSTCPPQRNRP
jgi:GGDEF domain-containing protein